MEMEEKEMEREDEKYDDLEIQNRENFLLMGRADLIPPE